MKSLNWILAGILVGAMALLLYMNGNNKDLGQENALLQQKIDGQETIIEEQSADYLELQRETQKRMPSVDSRTFRVCLKIS